MEITFKDIIRIIKKNLIFIIITSLVFAAGSYFITKCFIQKTYTATVKLYVETTNDGSTSYDSLQSYNYAEKLVATYIQMLNTNNFYTAVSKELNEKYTPAQIKESTTFTGIEETEVFEADVVAKSPTEAKNIADAISKTAPETIKKLNDNAQLKIVDEATLPKNPTSPNTNRNVLIALLIGLVLSLIISFVRDYFDVKIKYDSEMTTICNVPVLASIPNFEFFATEKKQNTKSNITKHW